MAESVHARGGEFRPAPAFWNRLSSDDKSEFMRLRSQFHGGQQSSTKDSRVVSLRNELTQILQFLERDEANREPRSILAGIAFAGPYVCVNTRVLKSFLGRCKSSVNGGLQQMGYVAIKTSTTARRCIITVMRTLASDPTLLRQWSVRGASHLAECCFASSFPVELLPELTPADLFLEAAAPDRPAPQRLAVAPPCPTHAFEEAQWGVPKQEGADVAWGQEPIDVDNDWVRMMNEWSAL
jgi:hypothetical protein